MAKKIAIIIGAGPAGLTAAYELLTRTDIQPIIVEATADIGGLAKTINYKGNRIDIGGHRFFSKSERVMRWWNNILPIQRLEGVEQAIIMYHGKKANIVAGDGPDPEREDKVMLVRNRLSRILFLHKLFSYPPSFSWGTARNLGPVRAVKIVASYLWARLAPIRPERSLEDFFINRFGQELYHTFFRDYTQKVWGVSCSRLPADWGAQRVKTLSLGTVVLHAFMRLWHSDSSLEQQRTATSLIERFLYPKFGPGQLWEEVARRITEKGGVIRLQCPLIGLQYESSAITQAVFQNINTGQKETIRGDYFFSTMPVKDLIACLGKVAPDDVRTIAANLQYRDFITVGILLRRLRPLQPHNQSNNLILDNWIYIQEPGVQMGRLQIFNNWSPYLVKDPAQIWLGLEYFCTKGDMLWNMTDIDLQKLAVSELEKIGFINNNDVLDAIVVRVEKTYPSYGGAYSDFGRIRAFTDRILNLFLIGRNGMHRYNNQDHSMLTAMVAVDNIIVGITTKDNIWAVNTEQDYQEEYDKK